MKSLWSGLVMLGTVVSGSAGAQIANPLAAESLTPAWGVSTANPMYINAYNLKNKLELVIFTDDLAPVGMRCEKGKVLKDVKFTVAFFIAPDQINRNPERIIRKVKMKISRKGQTYFPRAAVIDSYDKDSRPENGQSVRLGKLQFTSPYSCHNLDGVEFRIYNLEVNGRDVPELKFRVEYLPANKD